MGTTTPPVTCDELNHQPVPVHDDDGAPAGMFFCLACHRILPTQNDRVDEETISFLSVMGAAALARNLWDTLRICHLDTWSDGQPVSETERAQASRHARTLERHWQHTWPESHAQYRAALTSAAPGDLVNPERFLR